MACKKCNDQKVMDFINGLTLGELGEAFESMCEEENETYEELLGIVADEVGDIFEEHEMTVPQVMLLCFNIVAASISAEVDPDDLD